MKLTSSIDTNSADRDKHMRNEEFFAAEKHPTIRFVSTKITDIEDDEVDGIGSEFFQSLGAARRHLHVVPAVAQDGAEHSADVRFVVDDEDAGTSRRVRKFGHPDTSHEARRGADRPDSGRPLRDGREPTREMG